MKLVTFLNEKGQERVGILGRANRVIEAAAGCEWLQKGPTPSNMLAVIEEWDQVRPHFEELLAADTQGKLPANLVHEEKKVRLVSPIPRPVSMRDGYAFRQHVESARKGRGLPMIPEFDLFPIFYFTNHLAVTGPGAVAVQKRAQERLDFELEVAIVTGKRGKNIPALRADEFIFGYMIMNDWSARALQTEEMKLNLGPAKGKDFATSLGPYLVTRDELAPHAVPGPQGERHNLAMRTWVNGKQVSEGNLRDMTWTFGQILERVSYGVTVQPGEVIGSGTVGTGCFMELNATKVTDNWWLKPGDVVTMEVEGLGKLENTLVDAPETFVSG